MYKTLATVFILNNNHHENKRNQDCYLTNKEGLNYLNLPLIKVCEIYHLLADNGLFANISFEYHFYH